MKFEIKNAELLNALEKIAGIAGTDKSAELITNNVLIQTNIDGIRLTCTNSQIQEVVEIKNSPEIIGSLSVDAKKLLAILKTFSSDSIITIYDDEKHLVIKTGKYKSNLNFVSAEQFPVFQNDVKKYSINITSNELAHALNAVIFCVAEQNYRAFLKGINFRKTKTDESLIVTGADGHRMALTTVDIISIDNDIDVTVPKKTAQEFLKLLKSVKNNSIILEISGTTITAKINEVEIKSKLIEVGFPDCKSVVPNDCKTEITIDANNFCEVLSRIDILGNSVNHAVEIKYEKDNELILTAKNQMHEHAENAFICEKIEAEKFEIAFNALYLKDALTSLDSQKVNLFLSKNCNNLKIEAEKEDKYKTIYVVSRILL